MQVGDEFLAEVGPLRAIGEASGHGGQRTSKQTQWQTAWAGAIFRLLKAASHVVRDAQKVDVWIGEAFICFMLTCTQIDITTHTLHDLSTTRRLPPQSS